MKTLYVSDLDGTLFNSKKSLTDYTVSVINRCIDKGMMFTVATARMPYGCDTRLAPLNLAVPAILTNGVFLYDFSRKAFISVEPIAEAVAPKIVEVFRKHGASCFFYTYDGEGISIWFEDERLKSQTQYYSDRALESCREVAVVDDCLKKLAGARAFYVALTGPESLLVPIKADLDRIEGVGVAYYLNIYNGEYCLEVFSAKASKKNALAALRALMHSDELVVFGDNLNDLSMIEVADRSYAPANALPVVKERVTAVLEDSDHDGVARFLAEEWRLDG